MVSSDISALKVIKLFLTGAGLTIALVGMLSPHFGFDTTSTSQDLLAGVIGGTSTLAVAKASFLLS